MNVRGVCDRRNDRQTWARSEILLALRARKNAEHLAVFGHRTARDENLLTLEALHDLLVGERAARVLFGDDLLDRLLHALAGDVVGALSLDRAVEEVLEVVMLLSTNKFPFITDKATSPVAVTPFKLPTVPTDIPLPYKLPLFTP